MSTQPIIDKSAQVQDYSIISKPLKGKYDKRCKSPRSKAAIEGHRKSTKQYGPKPKWMKHLHRSSAYSILKSIDDQRTWPELFQWAIQREDARLCFDIMCYLTDRRDGKPFVATNPEDANKHQVIYNDKRLQVAIQTLLPTSVPPSTKQLELNQVDTQSGGGYQTHNTDETTG